MHGPNFEVLLAAVAAVVGSNPMGQHTTLPKHPVLLHCLLRSKLRSSMFVEHTGSLCSIKLIMSRA